MTENLIYDPKPFSLGGTGTTTNGKGFCFAMRKNVYEIRTQNPKLYNIWLAIKTRCYNPNFAAYKNYGGRGITVSDEWRYDFRAFYEWSLKNGYRPGLSIDRINNDCGYSPDNCRWVTPYEQNNNKRTNRYITFNGETKTLFQWSRETGIHWAAIRNRLESGWSVGDALTKEVRKHKRYTRKV